jgi:hypothetical protein
MQSRPIAIIMNKKIMHAIYDEWMQWNEKNMCMIKDQSDKIRPFTDADIVYVPRTTIHHHICISIYSSPDAQIMSVQEKGARDIGFVWIQNRSP